MLAFLAEWLTDESKLHLISSLSNWRRFLPTPAELSFTYSKSTIETLEKGVKYV